MYDITLPSTAMSVHMVLAMVLHTTWSPIITVFMIMITIAIMIW